MLKRDTQVLNPQLWMDTALFLLDGKCNVWNVMENVLNPQLWMDTALFYLMEHVMENVKAWYPGAQSSTLDGHSTLFFTWWKCWLHSGKVSHRLEGYTGSLHCLAARLPDTVSLSWPASSNFWRSQSYKIRTPLSLQLDGDLFFSSDGKYFCRPLPSCFSLSIKATKDIKSRPAALDFKYL